MSVKTTTLPSTPGVPTAFVSKFGRHVTGFLSGFDRLRFHGTLRMLFQPEIFELYLSRQGVLVKDFKEFALMMTARVKEMAIGAAAAAGRPMRYLTSSAQSKEDLAREIARKDRIKEGLWPRHVLHRCAGGHTLGGFRTGRRQLCTCRA
jgi:hypothetical protein